MTARAERSPLILVADDVPANVAALEEQLSTLGYRVLSAVDGPSALEACTREMPDLCILDVSMPPGALGCDARDTGFEVCRRIKREARTSRIPVIFVTALNDTSDRVKAIEAGGDDFLSKPHNRHVLSARVRSLLRLKFATEALEDSYRKLRELEKVRDDLMKMIVHDLKTPLASVLASLEMVLDQDFGPITEAQRSALGDAESKARGTARADRGPAGGRAHRGDLARARPAPRRARRAAHGDRARVGHALPAGRRHGGGRDGG